MKMDLKDMFAGWRNTRLEQQEALERALGQFAADPEEADQMLGYLLGRMLEDDEVSQYARMLRKALDRYSRSLTVGQVDEMDLSRWKRDRDL